MSEILETAVIADFLNDLKKARTSVLMLDYDGTLAPFQVERNEAYPYQGVIPLLEAIQSSGRTRIIVITGRPIHEVQALLQPLSGIEIWGAHGLDHLLADGTRQQAKIHAELVALLEQAEQGLRWKGMSSLLEIKPGGVAVHWRGLPEAEIEKIRCETLESWAGFAEHPGFKLLYFEGGLELRVLHPDKGDAVETILNELDFDVPVAFLGDDLTDEDGFQRLVQRGLPLLVKEDYRETAAKAWLSPPQDLLFFFEQWLSRTTSQQ